MSQHEAEQKPSEQYRDPSEPLKRYQDPHATYVYDKLEVLRRGGDETDMQYKDVINDEINALRLFKEWATEMMTKLSRELRQVKHQLQIVQAAQAGNSDDDGDVPEILEDSIGTFCQTENN